jgi:hypothetical protein
MMKLDWQKKNGSSSRQIKKNWSWTDWNVILDDQCLVSYRNDHTLQTFGEAFGAAEGFESTKK